MKIIILTGGIGSGKSTAGAILKELGAAVIDSDQVAREALNPSSPGFSVTLESFGPEILTPQGTIDRTKLSSLVFNNPNALQKLNRIVHPLVDAVVNARLQKYEQQGLKVVFIEMAVLAKAPFMERVDRIWVVKAQQSSILERLKSRGITEKDALARMANQPPVEDQIKTNPTIILNNGHKDDLRVNIRKLWEEL